MTGARIRLARRADIDAMIDIERAAGEMFRAIGMSQVADDDPGNPAELLTYVDDGRAWVAERDGRCVGYLIADVVDVAVHVEQVSVDPAHAGSGLGRALIATAAVWARERNLRSMTLTTFAEVPWNGPYYRRLGFAPVAELTPGLRAIRRRETAAGLDAWGTRETLRRNLDPDEG